MPGGLSVTIVVASVLPSIDDEGQNINKRFDAEGRLDVLNGLNNAFDNPAIRMARELQDSPAMRAVRDLESPLMRLVREFQDSPTMRAVRDLQESPLMRSVREFQDSSAMGAMRELQDSPITRALRGLESSSLMASLTRLSGTPFDSELIHQAVAIAHYAGHQGQSSYEDVPEELAAADAELNCLSDDNFDFSSLSEGGRRALLWLFYWIVLPFLVNMAAAAAWEQFEERAAVGGDVTTPHEAKRLAQCGNELEREIFAGCRVVTGGELRLRAAPGMKAQIITNLPLGKLLVILDSSERAWLLVEVDIEGELIEGWVARRYTTQFR
ncbi:SH3 domain-containing protein [Kushneria sp. AK178]